MREFLIERSQTLSAPRAEVFDFFADPANLGDLTPPWLHFHIAAISTPSIEEGTLIDYRLRVRGVRMRWRSVIRDWKPPVRFVDEQLIGPYRRWIHEHTFEDLGNHTLVRDSVRYALLGGALVNRVLVRPDLERIFDYRVERLAARFGG